MFPINPIPSGPCVQEEREANKPDSAAVLPASWTASVLLTPFGHANSPLSNYSQLVVGSIEYSWAATEHWMRTRLYLTQDQTYFDFVFISQFHKAKTCEWYWIDSTPTGEDHTEDHTIYGPFPTELRIPSPTFFSDMTQAGNKDPLRWGNRYPLMCTDTNPQGIDCDHWIGGRKWYAFRRDTGKLFRILTMDSANPHALPILGSYYLANIPTFSPTRVLSDSSHKLIERIRHGDVQGATCGVTRDPNPMKTQEDIHRAMACPLASASCTPEDIQAVLPGFVVPKPGAVPLPTWPYQLYIEGWTLYNDAVPYRTRVCYLFAGDKDPNSKQQTVLIGQPTGDMLPNPARPSGNAYLGRSDACLGAKGTGLANYVWTCEQWEWDSNQPGPAIGPPRPSWPRDTGEVVGQIVGNPNFGLASGEKLNLIQAPAGPGDIFWAWFLENGVGMLFSEATFKNPLLTHLEVIDYGLFVRDADVKPADFSGPFPGAEPSTKLLRVDAAHGHPTNCPHHLRRTPPSVTPFRAGHG
jgi:hypothetical protein